MIITNQVVKATIEKTNINAFIEEKKPGINISETRIYPIVKEDIIKPVITQEAINVKVVENPVNVSIPIGVPGVKGDKGDTGPSGASSSYSYITGEALGGHRVAVIDNNIAYYADNSNLSHINKPIGISNNASAEGEEINIVFFGEMEEGSWNWNINKPIFFNSTGELTQTEPTSGFSCIIATPITATKIFINKEEILIL